MGESDESFVCEDEGADTDDGYDDGNHNHDDGNSNHGKSDLDVNQNRQENKHSVKERDLESEYDENNKETVANTTNDDFESEDMQPALVPRRTGFWDHDNRFSDISIETSRNNRGGDGNRKLWDKSEVEKWEHDCFVESEQGPKQEWELKLSAEEIQDRKGRGGRRGRREARLGDFMGNGGGGSGRGRMRGGGNRSQNYTEDEKSGDFRENEKRRHDNERRHDNDHEKVTRDERVNYENENVERNRSKSSYNRRDNFEKYEEELVRSNYDQYSYPHNNPSNSSYEQTPENRIKQKPLKERKEQQNNRIRSPDKQVQSESLIKRVNQNENAKCIEEEEAQESRMPPRYSYMMNKEQKTSPDKSNNNAGNYTNKRSPERLSQQRYSNQHQHQENYISSQPNEQHLQNADQQPYRHQEQYQQQQQQYFPQKQNGGRVVNNQPREQGSSREKSNREKRIDQLAPRLRDQAREKMVSDEKQKEFTAKVNNNNNNNNSYQTVDVLNNKHDDDSFNRDKPTHRYSSQRLKPGASLLNLPGEVVEETIYYDQQQVYNSVAGSGSAAIPQYLPPPPDPDDINKNVKIKMLEHQILQLQAQLYQQSLNPPPPTNGLQQQQQQHHQQRYLHPNEIVQTIPADNQQQFPMEPMYNIHNGAVRAADLEDMSHMNQAQLNSMLAQTGYPQQHSLNAGAGLYIPQEQQLPVTDFGYQQQVRNLRPAAIPIKEPTTVQR